MRRSNAECEQYKPFPWVVDVWKNSRLPTKKAERVLLACAHEYVHGPHVDYKLHKRLLAISAHKKLKSIEFVSGRYMQTEGLFRDVPAETNEFFAWGNFFLYHQAQSSMYENLNLINKKDFTHQFTYYPGVPRLQRCKMIEEFAKANLLNSSIKYSWNGRPKSYNEAHADARSTGLGPADFKFKFTNFDNQRIIYYNDSTIDNTDNHQRINHFSMPQEICKAAPFNIVMESDPVFDFLTEKTYRTLANGIIPLLITAHKHYTYLQSLGFQFPQILLDFESTIPCQDVDDQDRRNKYYKVCNDRMFELVDTLRANWSDDLIAECIKCGKHNQLTAAKIVAGGQGIPKSTYIQLYYSHIINKARFQATKYLRRNHIRYEPPPPLPYCGAFNHNDIAR